MSAGKGETTWLPWGQGTFNYAYVNSERTEVLKIQKLSSKQFKEGSDDDSMDLSVVDLPERSVRLWNQINPGLQPPARLENSVHGLGWVCPFVKGDQASDKEMSQALLDIFNRTGRIIVDATAPENFIRRVPGGEVFCIDIGMALQMQKAEEVVLSGGRTRAKSGVSLDAWNELCADYKPFLKKCSGKYPETVATVKALLFIQQVRPDIFDVSFLASNNDLVERLAEAYDLPILERLRGECQSTLNDLQEAIEDIVPEEGAVKEDAMHTESRLKDAKETLLQKRSINLDNIKESCKVELERYINDRGSMNVGKGFTPSIYSRIFRNQVRLEKQVELCQSLIKTLDNAEEYQDLKDLFEPMRDTVSTGFSNTLSKCCLIIDNAEQEDIMKPSPSSVS
ncbi:MAG: hypothetical protein P1U32_06810 [Legionellaceae bacterium]|nr:hypothetical protein [Legionellaceae bacterium]